MSSFYWECIRKKKYSTYERANKVAKKVKEERGKTLYIYYCPHCQNFHLTHKEKYKGKDRRL